MSEFDEKLNALLSNPDSMAQIMHMAQSLSGNPAQQPQGPAPDQPPPAAQPPWGAGPQTPPSGQQYRQQDSGWSGGPTQSGSASEDPFSSLLGGLDPKLLVKLFPLLQELNNGRDSGARQLLYALRPYLKEERQEKIERALQLARLIHIGKKFLAGWEG